MFYLQQHWRLKMTDLKHCKPTERLSLADKYAAVIFIIAVIGGVLILNFMPMEWVK